MTFGVSKVVEVVSHRRALKFIVAAIVAGTVVMVIGLAVGISIANILHSKVQDSLVKDSYDDIKLRTEIKDYDDYTNYEIFMFNITNPDEVMAGAKPELEEVGPYIYRKYGMTLNATFNDDFTELLTRGRTIYMWFEEDGGSNPYTDVVTMANSYYTATIAYFGSELNLLVYAGATVFADIVEQLTGTLFPWLVITSTGSVMLSTTKSVVASQTTLPVFYSIWANYTSSPSAAFPDYLLLSYAGVPSGISYKKAALLWNCTSSLSFCNTDGAQTWAYAANGATTYQQLLITETGLTTSQFALVLTWLGSYWSNQVEDYLFTEYGIATISDLGFVQWGIGTCLGSVSVSDVQDIAIPVEVSIWAKRELGVTLSLTVTQSKALLTGTYALTDPTELGTFLTLVETGDSASFQTISSIWGLDSTSALIVAQYFYSGIMGTLVAEPLSELIYGGSGFFGTRTASEWIFATSDPAGTPYPDPLASYLWGSAVYFRMFGNDTTVAKALKKNSTTLKNTGKGDIRLLDNIIAKSGISTYEIWAEPVKVEGTSGDQFQPFRTSPTTYVLKMWSEDFKRRLDWTFAKEYHLKGIKLYKYHLAAYMLTTNATFYMSFDNFANMTSDNSNVPMFLSTPHFLDCPEWRGNVTGLEPDEEKHRAFLSMDSYTGAILDAYKAIQSNLYIDTQWKESLSYFHPGIPGHTMIPTFWIIESGQISDADATDFKNQIVRTENMSQQILLACVISGTLILVSGLTLLAVWLANRTSAASSKVTPIEGETLITTTIAEPTQKPVVDTGSGPTKITVESDTF